MKSALFCKAWVIITGVAVASSSAFADPCEPRWLENTFCPEWGVNAPVRASISWDDGTGEALYVGGEFDVAGCAVVSNIAKWDGVSWSSLGEGLGNPVYAMTVFDDGSGPALYVGGSVSIPGETVKGYVARWDGASWSVLEAVLDGPVHAMTVFDDGDGPVLYVGGAFNAADELVVNRIARWDGLAWSPVVDQGVVGLGSDGIDAVYAMDVLSDGAGGEPVLFVGGDFWTVGSINASGVARWDGSAWSALAGPGQIGISGGVRALTVFDDGSESGASLYVAGAFRHADGEPAERIARWDGSSWSALGSGLFGGEVYALRAYDGGAGPALYAGGLFSASGGQTMQSIARWDGSSWSPVSSPGMSTTASTALIVRCLTTFDDGSGLLLHAGGQFNLAGGSYASNTALWDGSSWSAQIAVDSEGLGGLAVGEVQAIAAVGEGLDSVLYAAGTFLMAGGQHVNHIAMWDGSRWSGLNGAFDIPGVNNWVDALASFEGDSGPILYVGGNFTHVGGQSASRIAAWDGSSWSALVGPGGNGVSGRVRALAIFDDGTGPALYATGDFTHAGGEQVNRIAKWDGMEWSALAGPAGIGLSGSGYSLAVFDDGTGPALYVGGNFINAGGRFVDRIAKWDGSDWSALIGPDGRGVNNIVHALMVFDDGNGESLYAGGTFARAGGTVVVNRIAKWDGDTWSALADANGVGVSGAVTALQVYDDSTGPMLYVGGNITRAGDLDVSGIARWDGASWSNVVSDDGVGLGGREQPAVRAMAMFDDGLGPALYVGGRFTSAGGTVSLGIAKWGGCTGTGSGSNTCPADLTGPALDGVPDGQVNISDLNYYLGLWLSNDSVADLTGPAFDGQPDGTVTVSDLNYFLDLWISAPGACP